MPGQGVDRVELEQPRFRFHVIVLIELWIVFGDDLVMAKRVLRCLWQPQLVRARVDADAASLAVQIVGEVEPERELFFALQQIGEVLMDGEVVPVVFLARGKYDAGSRRCKGGPEWKGLRACRRSVPRSAESAG